jgi:ABC-type polysaccharide/polyol phosphate export permease
MVVLARQKVNNSQWRWYWELFYVLVRRNLKRRYRGSFLGVYWSLLNPLIMTGLYTAILGSAFKSYYNNSLLNYVLAAFTGLVVINFFSSSTLQALASVVENGAIVNKIRLPLFVFPLASIGANIFQLLVGVVPLLAIVTGVFSKNLLNILALLFPLFALVLVCSGIGLLMSALYVFFRDLPYFYELFTFLLWISSPVFYPPDIVPEQVRSFLTINPLLPIIESIRQISLSGNFPEFSLIVQALLSGLLILTVGIISFRFWQNQFMDLL